MFVFLDGRLSAFLRNFRQFTILIKLIFVHIVFNNSQCKKFRINDKNGVRFRAGTKINHFGIINMQF